MGEVLYLQTGGRSKLTDKGKLNYLQMGEIIGKIMNRFMGVNYCTDRWGKYCNDLLGEVLY